MLSIYLEQISFAYSDASSIIRLANAHIYAGWTGLVGENGAGKTTLLRLIAGELGPDSGRISIKPDNLRIVLCTQHTEKVPNRESQVLAFSNDNHTKRLRSLLSLKTDDLERWPTLSPGERKRWQIGGALVAEPDILLLDEPTNHVDAQARALLTSALLQFRGIGILISHDRTLLDNLTTKTLRLHQGELCSYLESYSQARFLWEAEMQAKWDQRAQAQKKAHQMAKRLADARRTRDAAERSQSGKHNHRKDRDARSINAKTTRSWAENRLGREVSRLRTATQREYANIPKPPSKVELGRSVFFAFEHSPRRVLLSLRGQVYAGKNQLLQAVSIQLNRNDRIRLAGPNGAGKTSLIGALLANCTLLADRLLVLPQELPPEAGAALLKEVHFLSKDIRGRVCSLVAALGSDPDRLLASNSPSPGETRKLLLALGLGKHAWALVLDEPTNHLDLPTVERLETALNAYPGAILLVTHDDNFAECCTTRCWRITHGRLET